MLAARRVAVPLWRCEGVFSAAPVGKSLRMTDAASAPKPLPPSKGLVRRVVDDLRRRATPNFAGRIRGLFFIASSVLGAVIIVLFGWLLFGRRRSVSSRFVPEALR